MRPTRLVLNVLRPRRAILYVPASSEKMIHKSLSLENTADSIAYDLEDSVANAEKDNARQRVGAFLSASRTETRTERLVRINAVGTGLESEDLRAVLPAPHIDGIMLPKTESADHVNYVVDQMQKHGDPARPFSVVALIESARALMSLREIAQSGSGHLKALVFASEDFCSDLGLTRTPQRTEMLFARSSIVTAAKAYGLQAIDMVCVDFRNPETLEDECRDGQRMGFDGKQCIHPLQVDPVQSYYLPSENAVARAKRIVEAYEEGVRQGKGAIDLDGEMIDAPVLKQAEAVMAKARAGGLV